MREIKYEDIVKSIRSAIMYSGTHLPKDALDKMNEVLEEIPRVRKELGYPPLVTPTSQIVGTQAVFNILSGQRYKKYQQ